MARLTFSMTCGSRLATFCLSLERSMVRICSVSITESTGRIPDEAGSSTCVGSLALRILLVTAATMVVGL